MKHLKLLHANSYCGSLAIQPKLRSNYGLFKTVFQKCDLKEGSHKLATSEATGPPKDTSGCLCKSSAMLRRRCNLQLKYGSIEHDNDKLELRLSRIELLRTVRTRAEGTFAFYDWQIATHPETGSARQCERCHTDTGQCQSINRQSINQGTLLIGTDSVGAHCNSHF